jgi:hypothetical protein
MRSTLGRGITAGVATIVSAIAVPAHVVEPRHD